MVRMQLKGVGGRGGAACVDERDILVELGSFYACTHETRSSWTNSRRRPFANPQTDRHFCFPQSAATD